MFVSPLLSFLFYSYVSKLSMTLGGLALISAFWQSQIWGELHIFYCPFCVCLPQSSPNTMMWQRYESRRITDTWRGECNVRHENIFHPAQHHPLVHPHILLCFVDAPMLVVGFKFLRSTHTFLTADHQKLIYQFSKKIVLRLCVWCLCPAIYGNDYIR